MGKPPVAIDVRSNADIQAFFDGLAPCFSDPHGPTRKLLDRRLRLLKKHAAVQERDTVLEIGCGRGEHLLAFLGGEHCGIGVDLSAEMIQEARARAEVSPARDRIVFLRGNAEDLSGLADSSVGLVFAVGAFEHMFDKSSVAQSIFRVLRPGGYFLCLSPNGDFVWYSWLAPSLKINTKHLSTDVFLSRIEFGRLMSQAGFSEPKVAYWHFIPRGDLPPGWALLLGCLDLAGRFILPSKLRGGILVKAMKPLPGEGGRKGPGGGRGV